MTEPDTRIVINCPVCHRTIWNGSTCHHGNVPPPSADAPKELPDPTPPIPGLRGGIGRKRK